jgi:hypothetical protein
MDLCLRKRPNDILLRLPRELDRKVADAKRPQPHCDQYVFLVNIHCHENLPESSSGVDAAHTRALIMAEIRRRAT